MHWFGTRARRTLLWQALLGMGVLCLSAPALAQNVAQVTELERDAAQASAQGRHQQAAHAYHAAYELSGRADLLRQEMLAWFQASDCDHASARAHSYVAHPKANTIGKQMADELIVVCDLRQAQSWIDAGQLERASTALEDASKRTRSADARARIDALREIITHRSQLSGESDPEKSWVLEGVGAEVVASAMVHSMVASDREDAKLRDPRETARQRRKFVDIRRRMRLKHWVIPTLTSISRMVSREGVVLLVLEQKQTRRDDEPVEARLVPQYISGSVGARLRIKF